MMLETRVEPICIAFHAKRIALERTIKPRSLPRKAHEYTKAWPITLMSILANSNRHWMNGCLIRGRYGSPRITVIDRR